MLRILTRSKDQSIHYIRGLWIHVLLIMGLRLGTHKQQDMGMLSKGELRVSYIK